MGTGLFALAALCVLPLAGLFLARAWQSPGEALPWAVAGLAMAGAVAAPATFGVPVAGVGWPALALLVTIVPLMRAASVARMAQRPVPWRALVVLAVAAVLLQGLAQASGGAVAMALAAMAATGILAWVCCARIVWSAVADGQQVAAGWMLLGCGLELVTILVWLDQGLPAAEPRDELLMPGLLTAAALTQLALLGLLQQRWQALELVARERWAQEAEQRELASRETALLRRGLAEREALRQRDAWGLLRSQVLDGLERNVCQPLQALAVRLADPARDPSAAPSPAEVATGLVEALDAWVLLARLQDVPAAGGAARPPALALDFLLGLALQDLGPEVRPRVRLADLPDGVQLSCEPNLFRLGLRHLLRESWRGGGRLSVLTVVVVIDAVDAHVGLFVRGGRSAAEDEQQASADLAVVARICEVQGGWLERRDGAPPHWWLPRGPQAHA